MAWQLCTMPRDSLEGTKRYATGLSHGDLLALPTWVLIMGGLWGFTTPIQTHYHTHNTEKQGHSRENRG